MLMVPSHVASRNIFTVVGIVVVPVCQTADIVTLDLGSTHIKKLLKSGHCPEGGWVPGLDKLLGALFFHQLKDLGTLQNRGGGSYGSAQIGKFIFGLKFQF